MKKIIAIIAIAMFGLSAQAQTIVQAEKTNQDADLCFHKQIELKGYVFANIIGRCAWDPAMNGMSLYLVAQSEDPSQEADKIELGYIRNVTLVQNKQQQAQISITMDDFDSDDNVVTKKKVIYVRVVDANKGTFSVVTK